MKYALVTGGSRGIGKAICIKLSGMGYHVLINYKSNIDEAKKTLESIVANGGSGELLQFDVSNPDDIESAINSWTEKNTGSYIEVLVNNAGTFVGRIINHYGARLAGSVFFLGKRWNGAAARGLRAIYYKSALSGITKFKFSMLLFLRADFAEIMR